MSVISGGTVLFAPRWFFNRRGFFVLSICELGQAHSIYDFSQNHSIYFGSAKIRYVLQGKTRKITNYFFGDYNMEIYEKVSTNLNFVEREKQTRKFLEQNGVFEKSSESR